jgi:hypothetical protein
MGVHPYRFQRRSRHGHRSAALIWALVLAWSTLIGPAAPLHALDLGGTVLPQALGTTASPTFAGLTLSSPLSVPNGGTGATTAAAARTALGLGTGDSPTFTSATATNALKTTGALQANFAGTAVDWAGGLTRVFAQGPDASTSGRYQLMQMRSDGTSSVNILLTDTAGNVALGNSSGAIIFNNYATLPKVTSPGTAPGAGTCREEWVAGTSAGTCKKQAYCGTSTTPVVLVDNVGSGC